MIGWLSLLLEKRPSVSTTTDVFESMWTVIHVTRPPPGFLYASVTLHDSQVVKLLNCSHYTTFCLVIGNLGVVVICSLHDGSVSGGPHVNQEECPTSLSGLHTTFCHKNTHVKWLKKRAAQVVCETRAWFYFAGIWWIVSSFASNSSSTDRAYLSFLEWQMLEIMKCW